MHSVISFCPSLYYDLDAMCTSRGEICFLYFAKFFHMLLTNANIRGGEKKSFMLHIDFCQRGLYIKNYFCFLFNSKIRGVMHVPLAYSLLNNLISSGLSFPLTVFMVNTRTVNPKFSHASGFN